MKKVVILGAGRSAPYLIRRMVDRGPEQGWETVVADMDITAAQNRIGQGATHARAMALDATEEPELAAAIKGAEVKFADYDRPVHTARWVQVVDCVTVLVVADHVAVFRCRARGAVVAPGVDGWPRCRGSRGHGHGQPAGGPGAGQCRPGAGDHPFDRSGSSRPYSLQFRAGLDVLPPGIPRLSACSALQRHRQ